MINNFCKLTGTEKLWRLVLLALIPMLTVRHTPLMAPNEEPKWLVLSLLGVFLVLSVGWIFWKDSIDRIRIEGNIFQLLLTLFFILIGVGVFIAPGFSDAATRFGFWISCLGVWLFAVHMNSRKQADLRIVYSLLTLGSGIFSLYYWWYYFVCYAQPNYNTSAHFSPIGHVNFTGDVLLLLMPVMAWVLLSQRTLLTRAISWISLTSMLTILLIAASRGAVTGMLVAIVVLLLAVLMWLMKCRISFRDIIQRLRQEKLACALLGSSILLGLLLYQSLPYHFRDIHRVASSMQKVAEADLLHESLDNQWQQPPLASLWHALRPLLGDRTPILASSSGMIMDAPWLGHGTGSFTAIYPAYSNAYPQFRDALSSMNTFTTNPHNVFFQIATQNGLIAAMIFMFLLLGFWLRLISALWRRWDGWLAAGLVGLSAVIFDAMFNHVFFSPASMFTFALVGGCWWGALQRRQSPVRTLRLVLPWHRLYTLVLVIALLLLFVFPLRWLMAEYHIGLAMQQLNQRQSAQGVASIESAYQWNPENNYALHYKAQFAYQQGRYAESIRLLQDLRKLRPHDVYDLNLLAAGYIRTKQFDAAKEVLVHVLKIQAGFKLARRNLGVVENALRARASSGK